MRTTLTLDADVVAKLKAEMRRTGRSFKETVNEALRSGLATRRPAGATGKFVVKVRPLGTRPGLDYDRTSDLLEQLEGPVGR